MRWRFFRGDEPLWYSQERFGAKWKLAKNGCWLWQGKPATSGYGVFGANGAQTYAHRWQWYFTYGKWPQGKFICHTCDNRLCVNPKHLFIGTHADNMADASRKGRIGAPHNLSWRTRAKILKEYLRGGITQRALAKKYGTSQATVSEIYRGLHNDFRAQDYRKFTKRMWDPLRTRGDV